MGPEGLAGQEVREDPQVQEVQHRLGVPCVQQVQVDPLLHHVQGYQLVHQEGRLVLEVREVREVLGVLSVRQVLEDQVFPLVHLLLVVQQLVGVGVGEV